MVTPEDFKALNLTGIKPRIISKVYFFLIIWQFARLSCKTQTRKKVNITLPNFFWQNKLSVKIAEFYIDLKLFHPGFKKRSEKMLYYQNTLKNLQNKKYFHTFFFLKLLMLIGSNVGFPCCMVSALSIMSVGYMHCLHLALQCAQIPLKSQ
jgi:hypothetical protein